MSFLLVNPLWTLFSKLGHRVRLCLSFILNCGNFLYFKDATELIGQYKRTNSKGIQAVAAQSRVKIIINYFLFTTTFNLDCHNYNLCGFIFMKTQTQHSALSLSPL